MRRGAAWPAQRSSSWLVEREAVSHWQVTHRRAVMVAKRRRCCPQEHGGVAQRAPAGRGGPGGADAGGGFVRVSVSWASVRSPVSGAGVQQHACLSTRPLSGVRCGRLSVQMSGVRCPAWVSGVRGFPRPLCPTGRWWRARWGRQPHGWMAGVGVVAGPVHGPVRRLPGSEPGGRGWRRPCWASGGVDLDFAVVVGGGRGSGQVDRVGDRDWLDGRGDRPLVASRGRSEAATTLRGHRVRPRAESPGRCEPPGLDRDLRVRPWCGRRMR